MDLLHCMQLYARVVQAGSFSAAAREVGLTPGSVLRRIDALEDMLSVRLLNRTSRRLSLTEAGELYARRVEHILADIQETNAEVMQLQIVPRGTLRVYCRVSLGAQHLAPVLPDFLRLYPELRIDLQLSDHPVDLVQGNIDVAITVGATRDSSLMVRRLATSPRIVCASPAYLQDHAIPRTPGDLEAHNCLTFRNTSGVPVWRFQREGKVSEARVTGTLQADNAEVVRRAALGGLGVALLPEWLIGPDLAQGSLQPLLIDHEASPIGFDNGIYVVTQRARHRSIKVRLFVDFLVTLFRQRRNWRSVPAGQE